MPVISNPYEFVQDDLYVDLKPYIGHLLYLKCEGFNFARSVKLKAAREIVASLEANGAITPGSVLIESTSGNMGVAIAMIAASKGLPFVCVTDPRCNPVTRRIIEVLGADVRVVDEPDQNGGYLGSRLQYVREACAADPRYVWLNQYASPANWQAHYRLTGPAIDRQFPDLSVLFIGGGTAGTLMGCARYFRSRRHPPLIVAVDSVGSVAFGGPPGTRRIPGLGSGVPVPRLDTRYIDDVVMVAEADTIRTCRKLAAHGFLFGGSTGTVVYAATSWLGAHDRGRRLKAVALAPDLGEPYLDSIYHDAWVQAHYPIDPGVAWEATPERAPTTVGADR